MKKTILLTLPLCLALAACSGGSDGGSSKKNPLAKNNTDLPTELSLKPSSSYPKLSDEEKIALFALLNNQAATNLAELLLVDKEESNEDRQEREKDLADLPAAGKALADEVKQKCSLKHPEAFEFTTGSGTKYLTTTTKDSSIGGPDCPLSYQSFHRTRMNPEKILSTSPFRGTFRQVQTQDANYKVLKTLSPDSGLLVSQTTKMKSENLILMDTKMTTYSLTSGKMTGSYADGREMSVDMTIELIGWSREGTTEVSNMKIGAKLLAKIEGKTYEIFVKSSKADGQAGSIEAYLNGERISPDLIKMIESMQPASAKAPFSI